jgi:hypothetical protein
MLSDGEVRRFRSDGFLLVRNFLPPERVAEVRRICLDYFASKGRSAGGGKVEGDLPKRIPELKALLEYPPALEIARQLVGEKVMHPHESAAHFGPVNRGWHKDARDYARQNPRGTDWNDDYRLVHFVYYLQDHVEHSGGISVRRGSHRIKNHYDGEVVTIPSRAGDLVMFDLRTSHSGNTPVLRPEFGWIPKILVEPIPWRRFPIRILQPHRLVQPRLWKMDWLYRPYHADRLAVFFVYGAADQHTSNFFDYLRARTDEYPYLQAYSAPMEVP